MTKVDGKNNRLSRCGCLCHLVRPDFAAQEVALLRLCVHPLGGHVIRRLSGFLPDETPIPQTPLPLLSLLPLLPDLDVGNGGQDAYSILDAPWHNIMCFSHL